MNKLSLLLMLLPLIGCFRRRPEPKPEPVVIPEQSKRELLDLHNRERSRRGLKPLSISPVLARSAQKHAEWMAGVNRLTHQRNLRIPGFGRTGENIAFGQRDAHEAVGDWMRSRGHRRNILSPSYSHVGFGVAASRGGRLYWCVVFGG